MSKASNFIRRAYRIVRATVPVTSIDREILKEYSKKLVSISCNLCRSSDTEQLCFEQRFQTGIPVVICKTCGLIYLNPRWSNESYSHFYKENYRRFMGESDKSLSEVALMQRIHGSKILSFCSDFLQSGSSVIDIGCSAGGVLWLFREAKACHVVGVEPSVKESAYARERLRIQVRTELFEQVKLPESSFDLAIMTQTLNHLLDPFGQLEHIRNLLKPKGKLFVEVRNFPEYSKISRRPTQVDHVYYFTPETLECMLRKVGFEPLRTEVDTADKARLVHPYMWHRGAFIHIRMLVIKSNPEPHTNYHDYSLIRNSVLRELGKRKARWKSIIINKLDKIKTI